MENKNIRYLTPGQQYRVTKSFVDYDKQVHPLGETWIFSGTNFLPYDDGLTLHVIQDNKQLMYRLQWRNEEQTDIIENFTDFVEKC